MSTIPWDEINHVFLLYDRAETNREVKKVQKLRGMLTDWVVKYGLSSIQKLREYNQTAMKTIMQNNAGNYTHTTATSIANIGINSSSSSSMNQTTSNTAVVSDTEPVLNKQSSRSSQEQQQAAAALATAKEKERLQQQQQQQQLQQQPEEKREQQQQQNNESVPVPEPNDKKQKAAGNSNIIEATESTAQSPSNALIQMKEKETEKEMNENLKNKSTQKRNSVTSTLSISSNTVTVSSATVTVAPISVTYNLNSSFPLPSTISDNYQTFVNNKIGDLHEALDEQLTRLNKKLTEEARATFFCDLTRKILEFIEKQIQERYNQAVSQLTSTTGNLKNILTGTEENKEKTSANDIVSSSSPSPSPWCLSFINMFKMSLRDYYGDSEITPHANPDFIKGLLRMLSENAHVKMLIANDNYEEKMLNFIRGAVEILWSIHLSPVKLYLQWFDGTKGHNEDDAKFWELVANNSKINKLNKSSVVCFHPLLMLIQNESTITILQKGQLRRF